MVKNELEGGTSVEQINQDGPREEDETPKGYAESQADVSDGRDADFSTPQQQQDRVGTASTPSEDTDTNRLTPAGKFFAGRLASGEVLDPWEEYFAFSFHGVKQPSAPVPSSSTEVSEPLENSPKRRRVLV